MSRFLRPSGSFSLISQPRGTVLLELLVSSLILVVVIIAVGTFFLGHLRAFDRGKEQMELQRMGTLLMEGMVRAIREGNKVVGITGGPPGPYQDIQIFYPGEPLFDTNHNGTYDTGEDFIDIYQRDADGSTAGFQNVWNCASDDTTGSNPMPTVYFAFDDSGPDGGIITKGTDPSDSVPWDILLYHATRGSIWLDALTFDIDADGRSVTVVFRIRNDMASGADPSDDVSMDFSSSVNLRD